MIKYLPEGSLYGTAANDSCFKSVEKLTEAMEKEKVLEARAVMCDSLHNLIVDLGVMQGVIPHSEGAIGITEGETKDIALISKVNKAVAFIITDIYKDEEGNYKATLSRRLAQQQCVDNYIKNLIPGDIISGRITHLEPFGAFIDIGLGIPSLIPIDQISVSRISHPSDRFSIGDNVFAVVKAVDENARVYLCHKELLGTWEENASLFSVGETVSGIVRSVESYGVFVELSPNLAGLAEPFPGVAPGMQASVYIKSIIPEKMKIKLVLVDAFSADYKKPKLTYFINEGNIKNWVYSPKNSHKLIESVF